MLLGLGFSKETGFTQEDRERLIRLETTLKVFMEQVDRRFGELRNDINKRFEELREDMNKRFELMDKRFEQLYTFLWIITGIFTTLTVSVIAFAWWDRKTIIRKTKEETFEDMERELKPEKFKKLLNVLREKAKTDRELETILKKYGLL
ncbi:MAG TPA: hypothetical protein EYP32_02630 [Aquificaceae bacterium]|nr:hypothetical protein [Aquificaceae bacterium]HIQ49228.1 hypothetical protein [Aquifex aeolicus]